MLAHTALLERAASTVLHGSTCFSTPWSNSAFLICLTLTMLRGKPHPSHCMVQGLQHMSARDRSK